MLHEVLICQKKFWLEFCSKRNNTILYTDFFVGHIMRHIILRSKNLSLGKKRIFLGGLGHCIPSYGSLMFGSRGKRDTDLISCYKLFCLRRFEPVSISTFCVRCLIRFFVLRRAIRMHLAQCFAANGMKALLLCTW